MMLKQKKEIEKILLRLIPKIKEKNHNLLEARKNAIEEHTTKQIRALRNSQPDTKFVEEFLQWDYRARGG